MNDLSSHVASCGGLGAVPERHEFRYGHATVSGMVV